MKTVSAKLANMRKEQEFVVYPFKLGEHFVTVQSDKSIGQFDIETGKGVLNTKGSYFPHLSFGALPYQFPPEFVMACLEAQPGSGDLIGGTVYVA